MNSMDELIAAVQADINSEKEQRRKARNKRKAEKRKLREKSQKRGRKS